MATISQRGSTVRGLHVLVVEDYQDCATTMALLLERYGHEVKVAHDGETALEQIRAHTPDVVLLDIGLPGIDGYDVARELRASSKPPFVIALSGYGTAADRERSVAAGIDLHLVKPVEFHRLEIILRNFQALMLSPAIDDSSTK